MRQVAIVGLFPLLVLAVTVATGCSSASNNGAEGTSWSEDAGGTGAGQAPPGVVPDDASSSSPVADAGPPSSHGDSGTPKQGVPAGDDAGPPSSAPDAGSGSGAPARNSKCTPLSQQTGTAVDTTHGRLDGTLVYVLPMDGSSSCNGDSAHVHLQIDVAGSIYDVAVDIGKSGDEVGWYETTMAMPGGAWAEGWHGSDGLGYSSLGLSSSAFTNLEASAMGSQVESLLASTSKISVFCTGYTPEDNGCHDVHYQDGKSQDGAIALDPTSATSPILFFRFTATSF